MTKKIKSVFIFRLLFASALVFYFSSCGIHQLAATTNTTTVAKTTSVDSTKKTVSVPPAKKDSVKTVASIPKDSVRITSAKNPNDTDKEEEKLLKEKYAKELGVDESDIKNIALYKMVDEWIGVPYKWGGTEKTGCDCVGLCKTFYKNLYGKILSGSAGDVFVLCDEVKKDKLKEGDFVFFKINHPYISHIGIYLQNGYFVHASLKGVMIDRLDETYYKTYYFTGGRLKN